MNTQIENRVQVKLFLGIAISSELRLQLSESSEWKQAKISHQSHDLIETHYQNKDYIGLFLTHEKVCLAELKLIEMKILQTLKLYCPKFSSEKCKVLVFSQVFIS